MDNFIRAVATALLLESKRNFSLEKKQNGEPPRASRRYPYLLFTVYTRPVAVIERREATWQSPGREDGRVVHEQFTSLAGDLSAAFGLSSSLRSK